MLGKEELGKGSNIKEQDYYVYLGKDRFQVGFLILFWKLDKI